MIVKGYEDNQKQQTIKNFRTTWINFQEHVLLMEIRSMNHNHFLWMAGDQA